MSEQNTLHWRLKLKTGDSVLWYPHGIVNLVDRPVPGTWRVSGAALVGIVSAPEHDLRPMPGTLYTMVSGPVGEEVQPMPDVDADLEPEPPVVHAMPEPQRPSPVGGPAESEAATAPSFVLSIAAIRMDGGTQARAGLNWDTINDYADLMTAGVEFPPVIACFDGAEYWLADGFHRVEAARRTGAAEIRAEVRPGDARTARLHAAGANGDHGLPRTNNDKRRAVLLLLNDPEWARWSDREIARRCAVSQPFVGKVRAELTDNGYQSAERRGADGRTINTAGISASNVERTAKPAAAAEADYVHVYKTGERAGVSDVVKHYRPGCGGVVASVDQPGGVTVEWRKWNGKAQSPPYDVSPPMQPRDLSLVRRGYEEAALAAESERPSHVTEDGEIVRADEPAANAEPAAGEVPEWLNASVLVDDRGLLRGVVLKVGSQRFAAYRAWAYTMNPEHFATHQQAIRWAEGAKS